MIGNQRFKEGDTHEDVGIPTRGLWDGRNPDPLTPWELELVNAAYALALEEVDGAVDRLGDINVGKYEDGYRIAQIWEPCDEWDGFDTFTAAIFAATKGETSND